MGFSRMSQWMVLALMPIYLVTGCGDLEPEMQDTRTVILKMGFDHRSSSRTSSVSHVDLSQYNTHLILAVPSGENLHSSYWMYPKYNEADKRGKLAEGLMNTADNTVSLEIPLNKQMKIFAFLFQHTYILDDLISGDKVVGNYGKSECFSIVLTGYAKIPRLKLCDGTQTNNLSLDITLKQVSGTGTDTDTDTGTGTDNTAPTASVTAATITTSGNAVVQSTETGTAYLVKTTVSVSNNVTSITGAGPSQWNSVAIILANTDTNLPATGLADGIYKVYAVDASGNLSSESSNSVTVDTTMPAGTFLLKWGSSGTGDGQFLSLYGVAVDSSGNVYVADTNNSRIQKFSSGE